MDKETKFIFDDVLKDLAKLDIFRRVKERKNIIDVTETARGNIQVLNGVQCCTAIYSIIFKLIVMRTSNKKNINFILTNMLNRPRRSSSG